MCKNKYLNFYENKYMKELNKLELNLLKKNDEEKKELIWTNFF